MRPSFRALFNGTNATAPSLPFVQYQVQSVIVGRVPLQVGAVVEVAAAVVVVVVDDEAVTSKETVNKTFQLKHRVVQHSNVNLE